MDKATLRKKYRRMRADLTKIEVDSFNDQITQTLLNLDYTSIRYIHIFLPIVKNNEPNMWPYLEELTVRHPEIQFVVSRSNLIDSSMDHFLYSSTLKLVENKWGITEPETGLSIEETRIDLVLVPLLVADRIGNRVGYGKGFYDRFLAKCRIDCIKIGVSFFEPISAISDVDRYDILLDKLVTPQTIYSFR